MDENDLIDNHLINEKKATRSLLSKIFEYLSLIIFAVGLLLIYLDYAFGIYLIYAGLIGSLVSFLIFTYLYYRK